MKVKICGVTHPDDALYAARLGADYVGIIFSPQSKRQVLQKEAKAIAQSARQGGAEPVGVFVDESLEEIIECCTAAEIGTIQLHGPRAQECLLDLQGRYSIIYSIPVGADGAVSSEHPLPVNGTLLFDGLKGGSGKTFDWSAFSPPEGRFYLLAGGLNPDNVKEAIDLLAPGGVDVSSGVELAGSIRKDPLLVKVFIQAAKRGKKMRHPYAFGGQFLPEILMAPIQDLERAWKKMRQDPTFKKELDFLLKHYAGRPTPLTEVKNFAEAIQGPRIFLKREDLLHTGAHKINNALGQCLLAKYLGKQRIIAETGAGQHGVATATACAHLGLHCVVYMGAKDMERQRPNVEKMQLLGAEVIAVKQGAATLKDAVNEALRDWSANYESSHYCLGSALGPHPYPEMVRFFQSVISLEVKEQIKEFTERLPNLLIACVGGGSNAIGFFHHFLEEESVQLVGVEAGGEGIASGRHAARFLGGSPGVLHGYYSYLLQNEEGQILPTHSISAGLDYPAVGPDHAVLYESGRAKYDAATDEEALAAFHLLAKKEGIIPALESSHALAYLVKIAPTLPKDYIVIVNLSGRGDKDLQQVSSHE